MFACLSCLFELLQTQDMFGLFRGTPAQAPRTPAQVAEALDSKAVVLVKMMDE
jgi:hypothetical protein